MHQTTQIKHSRPPNFPFLSWAYIITFCCMCYCLTRHVAHIRVKKFTFKTKVKKYHPFEFRPYTSNTHKLSTADLQTFRSLKHVSFVCLDVPQYFLNFEAKGRPNSGLDYYRASHAKLG